MLGLRAAGPRPCRKDKSPWPGELALAIFLCVWSGHCGLFPHLLLCLWICKLLAGLPHCSVCAPCATCSSVRSQRHFCPLFESLCLQETHVNIVALETSGPGYFGCRELQALEPLEQRSCGGQWSHWSSLVPMAVLLVLPHPYLCSHASHSCCCCKAGA